MRANDVEEWRPVVGAEGFYEVSNLGRVRTVRRVSRRGCVGGAWGGDVLATAPGGRTGQYLRVQLHRPRRRFAFVHALVAEAFIGPRPEGLVILHRDDDGHDNRADRLRYGDRDENELDRHVAKVAPTLDPAPF